MSPSALIDQSRSTREQMKKMKKRRELDALVNGKMGRRAKKGQHELLRNDSESSETEEFSIPPKSALRNSRSCRFCATCMTVCGFFVLTLCVAAIAGLVWVHIELKKEVDQLRSQLQEVQTSPQEGLTQIGAKYNELENNFNDLKNTMDGIRKNTTHLGSQVKALRSDVNNLKENKSPVQSEDITNTVAQLGSSVTSLKGKFDTMDSHVASLESSVEELKTYSDELGALNASMLNHYAEHTHALKGLENNTESLKLRLEMVEQKPGSMSASAAKEFVSSLMKSMGEKTENHTDSSNLSSVSTERLDELQNAIDSVNATLEQLRNDQLTTAEAIKKHDSALLALKSQNKSLGDHQSQLESMQNQVQSLDDRLSTVESTMSEKPANQREASNEDEKDSLGYEDDSGTFTQDTTIGYTSPVDD